MTLALLVAGVVGFIALSYEILWFRAISFVTGGAPAAFGLLLGYYLAGIALGSFASRLVCRDPTANGNRTYLRHIGMFVLAANILGYLVLPALAWLAVHATWDPALGLVALAAGMLGAVLPLVSHFGMFPDRRAGTHLSYLYAANIVGSVLGSFLTGFVVLDLWPLPTIAFLLLCLGGLVVVVLLALGGVRGIRLGASVAGVALLGLLTGRATPVLFDQFYERLLLQARFFPRFRFVDVVENRSGVITVTRGRAVYGSGAYDGRISTTLMDDRNKIVRAYAIAALHPAPRRVLMIGLSTGAWAQVIAHHPDLEKLTVVEINPGYAKLIAKYPQVSSLLRNPKVEIIFDDGRRWLTRRSDRFDMIVSNTTLHWRAHSTNLLSGEYNDLIRAHLRPGGIYYFNTTGSESALKTAMVMFPAGLRFMNFAAVGVGGVEFDRERFRRVMLTYRIDGRLVLDPSVPDERAQLERVVHSPDVESRPAILARLRTVGLVTDDNMLPEWHPSAPQ